MDPAACLEGYGAIAVEFELVEPLRAIVQPSGLLEEHRFDEARANGRHEWKISLELRTKSHRVALMYNRADDRRPPDASIRPRYKPLNDLPGR